MNNELKAAIIFISPEGESGSRMLEPVVFAPPALWCARSLAEVGVERFLVVCRPAELEQAKACFPQEAQFITTDVDSDQARESLKAFLSQGEGKTVVLTKPVLFYRQGAAKMAASHVVTTPGEEAAGGAFLARSGELLETLAEQKDFMDALKLVGGSLDGCVFPLRNDYIGRAEAQEMGKEMTAAYWMERGVTVLDRNSVYIAPTVELESGITILPGTILRGNTKIGANCEIGPNTMLRDVKVGEGTTINSSQCNECTIGSHTTVGPFAYIRPNTHVGDRVKVGDFVELKNSNIGEGTKISHLTYVGDSDVGKNINFGCGTVTVNYDGAKKYRTVIDDDAFIGCNTNLVAPVHVGRGAYTGAGSTINQDVPPDSLAIARARQSVKKQWAAKRRAEKK